MFTKPLRAVATLIAFAPASRALAQATSDAKFAPGNFGTMVSGTIAGQEYIDHRLGANAGQEMFVELSVTESTGNGTV